MNRGAAFPQKTADAPGQYCLDLGYNRERYFLGRFTADVQSGRREQIVEGAIEIEGHMVA